MALEGVDGVLEIIWDLDVAFQWFGDGEILGFYIWGIIWIAYSMEESPPAFLMVLFLG